MPCGANDNCYKGQCHNLQQNCRNLFGPGKGDMYFFTKITWEFYLIIWLVGCCLLLYFCFLLVCWWFLSCGVFSPPDRHRRVNIEVFLEKNKKITLAGQFINVSLDKGKSSLQNQCQASFLWQDLIVCLCALDEPSSWLIKSTFIYKPNENSLGLTAPSDSLDLAWLRSLNVTECLQIVLSAGRKLPPKDLWQTVHLLWGSQKVMINQYGQVLLAGGPRRLIDTMLGLHWD